MKRLFTALSMSSLVFMMACTAEEAGENVARATDRVAEGTSRAVDRVQEQFDVATPVGAQPTREEMERERFNQEWQRLESFRRAQEQKQAQAAAVADEAALANVKFVSSPKFSEKLTAETLKTVETAPIQVPIQGDVGGPSVLRAQVFLDRASYSVGALDGRWGKNSAIAVYWFQQANGIKPTGVLDEPTFKRLVQVSGAVPPVRRYSLTSKDVAGPFTPIPEDVYEKEKLDCLCYENPLEALAERFHTTQDLLKLLNPNLTTELREGASLLVPNVREERQDGSTPDVKKIVVSIQGSYLHGYGADGRLLFHAPTTLGSKYDPSPNETVTVSGIAQDPHFHYQPKLFHEIDDDEPEANLQPGPNSPVGVVWMALSKPHFGIHGTSDPDSIGYASSHGCVRLTNWDARELSRRIERGITVEFVDTRKGATKTASGHGLTQVVDGQS
jgi:lipoprotein-anchoring transpeptidase ErfK/SrfK